LRRLPVKLAMAAVTVGGGYWAAMLLAPAGSAEPDSPTVLAVEIASNGSKEPPATGHDDRLILEVLETLERRPNIVAKLRQSVRLGDDRLSGEGAFWQQGVGNQRRTRWELTTLVAGERAFVTQVFDGEVMWTDRKLPASRKVTRVDIGALRRQLGSATDAAGQGGLFADETTPELLARGGVAQLVASMHRCFTFGPRQTLRRGDRTMLALIGRWRPEQLERLWPGAGSMAPADRPAHLPHHVVVYVDANDRFPYFVEFRGGDQAALADSTDAYYPARDALASFEFIDVQFAAAMPADIFDFTPPDNSWHDITSRLVDELRSPATAPEVNTANRSATMR
jgi:hypothetical protein